ncbi:MAG: cation diffusion facilitator family transporter [Dehalococcoidales bacterium]|nr:cation diffusion facilitator family transporter [Dehalococcoidales bacterium]
MFLTRKGAAQLSLLVVIGLFVLKIVVSVMTGSISILAQSADSFLDIFAVLITFLAVVVSVKPADENHPFGHGKVEYIATVVQGLLILSAGGLIIYSAILRIIEGTSIELTEAGIGVMLVSMVASILLSRHLRKVARLTDSMALEANAQNINADIYSAAAVLIGLVIIRFTKLNIIDPILALLVSLFILKVGCETMMKSFSGLVDTRLPDIEEIEIKACITEHYSELVSFHKLRTRKAGSQRYIDLHLVMPKNASIEEAHRMCDHLEQDIESRLRTTSVTIHVEPCSIECDQCRVSCSLRISDPKF